MSTKTSRVINLPKGTTHTQATEYAFSRARQAFASHTYMQNVILIGYPTIGLRVVFVYSDCAKVLEYSIKTTEAGFGDLQLLVETYYTKDWSEDSVGGVEYYQAVKQAVNNLPEAE